MIPSTLNIAHFYFGIEDYRVFIVDIPIELFTGEEFVPIVKPSMRRLISN